MMPVSSDPSVALTAGSIATTTRESSGIPEARVASIIPRFHKAPGALSRSSASISCRPSHVPLYLRTICPRNAGARLALFSYVDPRVTTTVGSAMSLRINFVGRGVVVTTTRGSAPNRKPNISMSQASGYRQLASSSHHAASCWGPRSRSGSSALKRVATAPLGHVRRRFDGS